MKYFALLFSIVACAFHAISQNVGIGTNTPTENFHVVGNKTLFENNYVSIGAGAPASGYTQFQLNKNTNSYLGMYINSGATGIPFYGFALNGVAKSYMAFNGTSLQFEYHQSSDATPDFFINANTKAVFNTAFLGLGTSSPTTSYTGFAMKSTANTYYGSYIDAGATGIPFYGFALNGVAKSYMAFNGNSLSLEYHQSSDATPDFYINANTKAVFNTAFLGLGTSSPTSAYTGFAMKSNVNTYYGSYIDAGATGIPFYGYALNGTPVAYTTYNGGTSQFEYHHSSDATPDFSVSNTQVLFPIQTFLGVGTGTPTNSSTGFTLKNNVNAYYGMYIDAGATGRPFYGFALNGVTKAWTELNGGSNTWQLNYGGVRMAVTSSGNVGIGTTSPSQLLDVAGTIHATNLEGGATSLSTDASGNIIRTPSDARLKNNIEEINHALDKLEQLHGVTYDFKDKARFGYNRQMGFLAQDLEKVVPEAVSSGGEYKSVNYQVLTALITEAVKEQQNQINASYLENQKLKEEIMELHKRIDAIEKNR